MGMDDVWRRQHDDIVDYSKGSEETSSNIFLFIPSVFIRLLSVSCSELAAAHLLLCNLHACHLVAWQTIVSILLFYSELWGSRRGQAKSLGTWRVKPCLWW